MRVCVWCFLIILFLERSFMYRTDTCSMIIALLMSPSCSNATAAHSWCCSLESNGCVLHLRFPVPAVLAVHSADVCQRGAILRCIVTLAFVLFPNDGNNSTSNLCSTPKSLVQKHQMEHASRLVIGSCTSALTCALAEASNAQNVKTHTEAGSKRWCPRLNVKQ